MGDADHFSQSTDRDILSDEDGVKCRENEKEVITTSTQQSVITTSTQSSSSSSQPVTLKAKKTPRGKSSRKNNRRQALVLEEDRSGYRCVNAAEHEEQFCSCVNLYVDCLLVRAVKELVVDAPMREKEQKESDSSQDDRETGMNGGESEPVFTATDDSYMDLIREEIHSTLQCNERRYGFDKEGGDEVEDSVRQRDGDMNKNFANMSPPLLSTTEGERSFELAADDYMNTSFPENEYDTDDDAFEDVPSLTQPDVSGTTGERRKQNNTRRRKYEFEVDCETGMVFSFEIVEPGEERESHDEYEYEDCDDCDACDEKDSPELNDANGESNVCLVEFEPDDDSSVFRVIDENEDLEETVYMVVDENGTDNKLARKNSDFRSRSPTKLPRAIREGTETHRRRCYSTGDADRFESLESSSSEFYSHADTLDRILTLPSPPKSSPGSYEVDDSEDDLSSSQEELAGILDRPSMNNHQTKNVTLVNFRDGTADTTDAFGDDLTTAESKCFFKNNQQSQPDNDHNSDHQDEDERRWQDLRVKQQMKLNKPDVDSPHHGEVSYNMYNTNHRATTKVHPVADIRLEYYPEMENHRCPALNEMDSSAFQDTPSLNTKGDEQVTRGDEDNTISAGDRMTQSGCFPLHTGSIERQEAKELVEQHEDADENLFEYIRNRRGRLCRREVNELLTDLAKEQEAMDRMLRDAYRAQEEFIQLRKGVKKLLERLESCQPA